MCENKPNSKKKNYASLKELTSICKYYGVNIIIVSKAFLKGK